MRVNDALGMLDQVLQEESESTLNLFLDHCGCGAPCESFSILNNGTRFVFREMSAFCWYDPIRLFQERLPGYSTLVVWTLASSTVLLWIDDTQHHEAAAARKDRLGRLSRVFTCCEILKRRWFLEISGYSMLAFLSCVAIFVFNSVRNVLRLHVYECVFLDSSLHVCRCGCQSIRSLQLVQLFGVFVQLSFCWKIMSTSQA